MRWSWLRAGTDVEVEEAGAIGAAIIYTARRLATESAGFCPNSSQAQVEVELAA
jgi:hypothetical protein